MQHSCQSVFCGRQLLRTGTQLKVQSVDLSLPSEKRRGKLLVLLAHLRDGKLLFAKGRPLFGENGLPFLQKQRLNFHSLAQLMLLKRYFGYVGYCSARPLDRYGV